jgi:hypothetical protein
MWLALLAAGSTDGEAEFSECRMLRIAGALLYREV